MKKLLLLALLVSFGLTLAAANYGPFERENGLTVIQNNPDRIVVEALVKDFTTSTVDIDGKTWQLPKVEGAVNTYTKGAPALPFYARSLIIGGSALMDVQVIDSEYKEFTLDVVSSRGLIKRNIDPATVPYTFGQVYQQDSFWPQQAATLGEPYIMRDYRGVVLTVNPFAYNPQTRTLRVYTRLVLALQNTGVDNRNVLNNRASESAAFSPLYKHHFINYSASSSRYNMINEIGNMIVIAPQSYAAAIQPLVDWKNQKGITTNLYIKEEHSLTSTNAIQSFIDGKYTDENVAYVLLVGDGDDIPTYTLESGGADPMYALVAGSDNYPDLFIGRFSAESTSDVATQVERTIAYERDLDEDATWLKKAIGIASEQGGVYNGDDGESDQEHQENLRVGLLNYTYDQVDQLYHNYGATSTQVSNAVNEGRGLINYTGHGNVTLWGTTNYSNSHVNALTNVGKLPFIMSAACLVGNFVNRDCFAEAWTRATYNGQPTGAVATYMSSISQEWDPPMQGQDESIVLMSGELVHSLGSLWYHSSCSMMDQYGTSGANTFKTWLIFGDPSLQYRTDAPREIYIDSVPFMFIGMGEATISTNTSNALVALSVDGQLISSGYTDQNGRVTLDMSGAPDVPTTLTLTVSGYNKVTNVQEVELIANNGPYVVPLNANLSGPANYGQNLQLTFDWNNAGTSLASDVVSSIATDDPYIQIIDDAISVGDIETDSVAACSDTFSFAIAANVPDQHVVDFVITTSCGRTNWQQTYSLVCNAPDVRAFTAMVINDDNSNGIAEPGEDFEYRIMVRNLGSLASEALSVQLACNEPGISIGESRMQLPGLLPNGNDYPTFSISLDFDMEEGGVHNLGLVVSNGQYTFAKTCALEVGSVKDDFESGTLTAQHWVNDATYPWVIDSDLAQAGSYCIRSSNQGHNSTRSTIQISMTSPEDGEISFWSKVSSEDGYDFLNFYIDNVEQGDGWSGNVDWSQHTYDVPAGAHVFKWTYQKDYYSSTGDDTAWLDGIIFPPTGESSQEGPMIALQSNDYDFGEVSEAATTDMIIYNLGSQVLSGTITVGSPFSCAGGRNDYSYSVQPYESLTLDLGFTPPQTEQSGQYQDTIVITSNDPYLQSLSLDIAADYSPSGTPGVPPAKITALGKNRPNPFNPETVIDYSLKTASAVKIDVYNIKGQKVVTLVDSQQDAGNHEVTWKGKDQTGKAVGSGIYFMKMKAGSYKAVKKMMLLK